MNYLAHLLLADDNDASRIGNLLGDFVRGPVDELPPGYPAELLRGIRMHRAVDRFTDTHPVFKEARHWLDPQRRRFAGIIVDIFFDHYLCIHWKQYSHQPLRQFVECVYQALDENPQWHAGRLAEAYPNMRKQNWLLSYATIEGIGQTLQRVSTRSPRITAIAGGAEDLRRNYRHFESCFHQFMPGLLAFADTWKKSH